MVAARRVVQCVEGEYLVDLREEPGRGRGKEKSPCDGSARYSVSGFFQFSLVVILACYFTGARPSISVALSFFPSHLLADRTTNRGTPPRRAAQARAKTTLPASASSHILPISSPPPSASPARFLESFPEAPIASPPGVPSRTKSRPAEPLFSSRRLPRLADPCGPAVLPTPSDYPL
jgi:hypothetical protein